MNRRFSGPLWRTGICVLCLFSTSLANDQGYPTDVESVDYRTDADGTMQPTLWWSPDTSQQVPLLVALHTWSNDYRQAGGEVLYAKWCQRVGWAFIHPNFRGVNSHPDAMGSDLAVKDITSAVKFAKTKTQIDARRIYCVGVSGGGHASMLVAARAPEIWAGVSSWCGISDIAKWHRQCKGSSFDRYANHIEQALQGEPASSEQHRQDAMRRSPVYWLSRVEKLPPLDINHGIEDGRAGSVPFSHALVAWNACVDDSSKIPQSAIDEFYRTQTPPRSIVAADELYGDRQPQYRRVSGNARLTIFKGSHEIIHEAALNWLAAQEKGKPVVWTPTRRESISEINQQPTASGD